MELWRASRLATALRQDRLSERQKLAYLLVGLTLQFFIPRTGLVFRGQTVLGLTLGLLLLGVMLWGTWRTFALNQQGDGAHFLERYLVLGLPVMIQAYVRFGAVALAGYLFLAPRTHAGTLGAALLYGGVWAVYLAGLLWFYRRLGQCIAHAAGTPGSDAAPA